VRVTGGMSLVDGGRWPDVACAEVYGSMPVLMMGGVSSVEMAGAQLAFPPAPAHVPGWRTIIAVLPYGAHAGLEARVQHAAN
jgi:hypothetical protein